MNMRWILAGVGALGLGLAAVPFIPLGTSTAAVPGAAVAGCDAKPTRADYSFTVTDVDGKSVRLADYTGKVVMLNFFATWCGPCKFETPMFVQLQEQYRSQGVAFIGVQVQDDPALLGAFRDEYKVNYPLLVANERDDIDEAYGPLWGLPMTLMIGRDGTICKRHMGLASKEQVEKEIRRLL
ncbi:MAG: TlpA family protein disulfide reductase [Acidobacteria bacterium]|nr:TlpA family protein disulfide reductase [Acidobacteriota bacterium]